MLIAWACARAHSPDAIAVDAEGVQRLRGSFAIKTEAREWVDREVDEVEALRTCSQGRTKPCKKSDRQRRRVPLRAKVLELLDQHPRRIDSRLAFRARRRPLQAQDVSTRATGPRHCATQGSSTGTSRPAATRSPRASSGSTSRGSRDFRDADRPHVRAPGARLGGVPARPPRQLRQRLRGGCCRAQGVVVVSHRCRR